MTILQLWETQNRDGVLGSDTKKDVHTQHNQRFLF